MRISRKLSLSVFVVLAVLTVAVAPVSATVIHQKLSNFTGFDAPGGPFGPLLSSDAIDQSNGDVYVTESNVFGAGQNVVDKFDETGKYAGVQITGANFPGQETFVFGFFSGVAVDNSAGLNKGDVYVADTGHGAVDRFSATGVFICQITGKTPTNKEEEEHECNGAAGSLTPDGSIEPTGLAVDTAGIVYVADDAHETIDKFGEKGEYLGQIKDPHLNNNMATIAVDSAGNLYVTRFSGGVFRFDAAGSFVAPLTSPEHEPGSVAVDPHTGNVYVYDDEEEHQQIAEYEPSGALLSVTPAASGTHVLGLAVDGVSGKLYASEFINGSVSIYSGDVAIPTMTAPAATNVTETSATLNGHLDPDAIHSGGEVSECEFEWGATTAYGNTAPCSPTGPYTSAADVSARISALTSATTYHFRVKARNANGPSESADETFTTAGAAVIDAQSSRVNGVAAELTAQINPYAFRYDLSGAVRRRCELPELRLRDCHDAVVCAWGSRFGFW